MAEFSCLYDCGSDAPSTQEYHIYPESASVMDLTLPPGEVCDKCNNYFSKIEGHFSDCHPGAAWRVIGGVVTKKGKTPRFIHQNGKMTRIDEDGLHKVRTQVRDLRHEAKPNGDIDLIGTFQPRPFDATKVSRVIYKIALEVLLRCSEPELLNPRNERFAPLREYVRRPRPTDFRPFVWHKMEGPQRPPQLLTIQSETSGEVIAQVCEIRFPGVGYVVAYPPWPIPEFWELFENVVSSPGLITPEPSEIRITLIKQQEDGTAEAG